MGGVGTRAPANRSVASSKAGNAQGQNRPRKQGHTQKGKGSGGSWLTPCSRQKGEERSKADSPQEGRSEVSEARSGAKV